MSWIYIRAPIREQYANLVILEYPQIHVFLPLHCYDFDVIKVADPCHHQLELKECFTIHHPSPKGISFTEEEIEEHGSYLYSQVLDLMQNEKPTQANKQQSSPPNKEHGENMDFDFEQGLLDVYYDIINAQVSAGGVSQSSEIAWLLDFHRNLQRCNIDMLEQHLLLL